ncbi:site-specific integrase [Billgrantia diversa]|uniref:tyrosine-type recombinase/integrase n=1 Tax=Halomonas sp. MCCC 1A13316 TaxID=2733487 RepID=UPI0018A51607|nr:tyrosine-type recombinase/integrase [Halomonas sp. MCCC 1A13316]QOR37457.1 site-specific integrase [Halomonas sp. MCCC 1A13316]
MGKVRARKETGKLYLDFFFHGVRCREQTALHDTPANRKKVECLLQRIEAKILLDEFDYAEFFPGSGNLKKVQQARATVDETSEVESLSTSVTLAEFSSQWFSEMQVEWRKSHTRNVQSIIDNSLKPLLGAKRIKVISKADLLQFRSSLANRKGRGANIKLSPKTINSHMAILKMVMDEAADRYGFESPYRNIKPLKLKKSHIEPFSLKEVDRIISQVREDYRNYYIVRFYTGLRTGEIDGLKWQCVDFERQEILVRETLIQGETEYTKTDGSQREVPMLGPVCEALKEQYMATKGRSSYVFCNRQGEPLDHNNVTKRVWYPLLRRLGLNKRRPYQTRHTAATLFLASGENPEWVARVLGHSSTDMLFKVYSRYIPNATRMDGSAFEKLVNTAISQAKEPVHEKE